jgi:nucleoside-diphosphate-sugar epimerase
MWLRDFEFDDLFASVEAVVHAGAAVPRPGDAPDENQLFDANVRSVANLGEWARRRGVPLIHISGAIVYTNPGAEGLRESDPLGWSGLGGYYGFTKLLAEDVLRREEAAGLQVAIVRPTSIYGFGLRPEKLVPSTVRKARSGEVIELREPVEESTNLIHAADVASAVTALLRERAWITVNVAADANTSILTLAETCVALAGRGTVEIVPSSGATQPPTHRFRLNTELAKARLNWAPSISLADGIRSILDEAVLVAS